MVRHLLALLPADVVAGLDTSRLRQLSTKQVGRGKVTQWYEEALDKGMRRGMQRGMAEGERVLLRRLAAGRFGVATGNTLAALLASEEDVERLAEVGGLVVACTSAEELLQRSRGLLNGGS